MIKRLLAGTAFALTFMLVACEVDRSELDRETAIETVQKAYKAIEKGDFGKAEKLMTPENLELTGLRQFDAMVGSAGKGVKLPSSVEGVDWGKYEFTITDNLAKLAPTGDPEYSSGMPKVFYFKKIDGSWYLYGTHSLSGI